MYQNLAARLQDLLAAFDPDEEWLLAVAVLETVRVYLGTELGYPQTAAELKKAYQRIGVADTPGGNQ